MFFNFNFTKNSSSVNAFNLHIQNRHDTWQHFLIQKKQKNNNETGKIRIDQRNFFTREIYVNQIGTHKISMQSRYSAFLNNNACANLNM